MKDESGTRLSGRERQVLDLIHAHAPVSAEEIRSRMADPPTNSAVRSTLRSLIEKGCIRFEREGKRYLYLAAESSERTGVRTLRHAVRTFFEGSVADAVSALLEDEPSEEEMSRIRRLIDEASARADGSDR